MTSFRLLAATAALLMLGACGSSGDNGGPGVASLSTTGPAPAASASAEPGVQLRLDSTHEEEIKLFDLWQDCLIKNGTPLLSTETLPPGKARVDWGTAPKAALDACASKRPIGPPEMDPDKNPNFAAEWEEYVHCLRDHGFMVHSTEPGSWTYDSEDTTLPEDSEKIEIGCMVGVFGAEKK